MNKKKSGKSTLIPVETYSSVAHSGGGVRKKIKPLIPQEPKKSLKDFSNTYYKQLIRPLELELNEREKLVISVQRAGDLGLPHIDIRIYDLERSTYTKKGINLPLEAFLPLLMLLTSAANQVNSKRLFDEVGVLPAELDTDSLKVICPMCHKTVPLIHTALAKDPDNHAVRVCLECHQEIADKENE